MTLPVLVVAPPLFGQASQILTSALRTAGLGHAQVTTTLSSYSAAPRVVVALGNNIAKQLVGAAWPEDGVHAVRGYWWDTPYGRVMGCVSPADIVTAWTPWRALLDFDMKRVAAEAAGVALAPLDAREVVIVTDESQVAELHAAMQCSALTAVDIENTRDNTLACMGFAPTPQRAWVIPAHEPWQLRAIKWLCESPAPKALQNGQYDRFFLSWFCKITLRNQAFDTMLAWHALNPELAGKAVAVANRKASSTRTSKSLKFLASIYTRDTYWKEYSFQNEAERYMLCGKDCCITLDIAIKQARQLETV